MSPPRLKLDRSRDHATVHGEGAPYAFEQDGLPFDHHGYLAEKFVPANKKALVDKKLKKLAKLAEGEPVDEDKPDLTADVDDDDDADADASLEINLEAWLKDEVKYEPHLVFKEAKRRYNKVFSNYRDLAEFLVFDEQICGPEDVPTKLGPKTQG
ncbi:hypothetical protein I6F35_33730 [Bradyrhizobium sp. BRP22]|uniref:hypothetical protein n=1 Tax=Bradyrhizobium sp. BRP22 TaxID=2793821 RepID=UPI001CD48DDF|nr:hypothetical protein [Bradyrhizobium sp. BRP22]MCA1458097.1 hypothetical protein [Bradyrhizobium sp. BRP22]